MDTSGRYLIPAPRILRQQVADTVVLLDVDTGEYYGLDEVGSRVWELCDGSRLLADIVAVICAEYDAPAAEIDGDVRALVEDLLHEKLLLEVGAPA